MKHHLEMIREIDRLAGPEILSWEAEELSRLETAYKFTLRDRALIENIHKKYVK